MALPVDLKQCDEDAPVMYSLQSRVGIVRSVNALYVSMYHPIVFASTCYTCLLLQRETGITFIATGRHM
jgi:hypothetical protein